MKEHGIKSNEMKGIIYLFKNDKMIREQIFHRKYKRQKYLKEFMEIAKVGTDDSYYITIKLDI